MIHPERRAEPFPKTMPVDIALDEDPRYRGSIHDDAVARKAGFRAALIPGAFVYGHFSRLAILAWGEDWARHGAINARFRRPVYNGDHLILVAGEPVPKDGFAHSEVTATNQEGETVATGWIAMPDAPLAPPDASGLAILPRLDIREQVDVGTLVPGLPVLTYERELTGADIARSLSAFGERHPIYAERGFVHSGCLMRLAMGDTNNSYAFPAPIVLTEAEAQHYALVHPGQRIKVSGAITDVYERNGRHYFASEEFMLADDIVVARFRRASIYAGA